MLASEDKTDNGFLNSTLAYFDTQDFEEGIAPLSSSFKNVTYCRYLLLSSCIFFKSLQKYFQKHSSVLSQLLFSCRYKDYRNPPWSSQKYERPTFYYQVLVARLTFVVIFQVSNTYTKYKFDKSILWLLFQNVVSLVKVAVQWLIPDVPNTLSDRIKRESYLTTQMIIKNEAKKAAGIKEKIS